MATSNTHILPSCTPDIRFNTANNINRYFEGHEHSQQTNENLKTLVQNGTDQLVVQTTADQYSPRSMESDDSVTRANHIVSKGHNSKCQNVTSSKSSLQNHLESKVSHLKLPEILSPRSNLTSPNHTATVSSKDSLYDKTVYDRTKARQILKSNSPNLPHVNIPGLDRRQNTRDIMKGPEAGTPIPLSTTDRKVTVVRNAMYGNFLRKSTKKLQDDLRHTMRVYSTEKHQLLRQLANLRHEMDELRTSETSSSPTSTISDSSRSSKSTRFFHAPNIAANKQGSKKGKKNHNGKGTEAESNPSKNRDGILKLPQIGSSSEVVNASSEWDSGNISQTNLPPIDQQPKGIAAAKALLDNNYNIPKNTDPAREDISLPDAKRSQREKKKVHFAAENKVTEFHVGYDMDTDPKNWQKFGEIANHLPHKSHKHHKGSKKGRSDKAGSKSSSLAPLKKPNDPKEAKKVAADYKALYVSIQDPVERTKTLADILYAVRIRMQDNEQNLKFGELPKPSKTDNTLCDFLLKSPAINSSPDETLSLKTDSPRQGKHYLGPIHTAARIGRRSNSIQLQNYLRKMSKSRRMIEHIEAEEYRLTHIVGHKQLLAVSQAATTT